MNKDRTERNTSAASKISASKTEAKISIVIADDSKIIRQGLKSILDFEDDLKVVAEADDSQSALEMVELHKPDVILMDVSMPGSLDGIETTRLIVDKFAATKVIGLSLYDDNEMIAKMENAGVAAFVSKANACENLADTIRKCCTKDFIDSNNFKQL